MSKTPQQQLADKMLKQYPKATIKKIDKDNYLDIHIPAISEKIGTHFTFNTTRNGIKLLVYSKDEALCEQFMENSSQLEPATRGVRLKDNPIYETVDEAIEGALFFIGELSGLKKEPVLKKAVPKKAVPKKAAKKKDFKPIEEDEPEEISGENDDVNNEEDSGELNDLFSKILGGNFTVNFVTNRPDLISAVADKGDLNEVKKIIKEGQTEIDVRDSGEDAYTAVHFAAWDGKVEILKYLIKAGADTDIVGNDGDTALHLSVATGKTDCVKILLETGVNIERRRRSSESVNSKDGDTPLRTAFMQQHWPIIELLLDKGAKVNVLNEPCSKPIDGEVDLFTVTRNEAKKNMPRFLGKFDKKKTDELENKLKGIASNKKNNLSDKSVSKESIAVLAPYVNDEIYATIALSTLLEIALDIAGESKIIPASLYDKSVLNKRLSGIFGVSIAAIMASGFLEDDVITLDDFKQKSATNINEIRDWYFNLSDKKIRGILPSIEKAIATIAIKWDDYMQVQGKVLCDSIKILANEKGLESDGGMKIVQLILDGLGISEEDWNNESVTDVEEEFEEEEIVNEDEQQEDDTLDLDDYDVNEDQVIKYICDKIKREKYLTNLLYVNQALDSKGYAVDRHQAYFFDSNVLISDNEMQGFLVVNMDGFYSNCVNEEEMQMIFSWSGANDLEYQEDGDDCSIDIIADQGRLTIKKEGSHSLKILYTFYKHVWKAINDKFKDEPIIVWNDVWDMGIKEVGFAEFLDYYTFDVTPNESDVEEEEIEDEEIEEDEIENDESDAVDVEDTADDFSFAEGKPYQKYFNRFLEIANKTGIHINDITVEPNNIERDEIWEITRTFAARIYHLDNDKNADQNELNFLCYYAIVSLHWCDIFDQSDKRYSYLNGRFRRDTVALAICFFARIDREFKYYDFIKESMVSPHMQFSVLMWTINTIINNNQDTLFVLFNPKQAEQANELFKQLTRKNGGADPINPNDAPENHPLRSIWWEVYRQFNNVRIPYQFIKSYISQIPPKRSFIQNLFGSKSDVKPGMNVSLLGEDRIKNIAFLEKQMLHKQFPDDWNLYDDLTLVYIYFATSDGNFSKEEKENIVTLIGEWVGEEDLKKLNQIVNASITKAQTLINKDNSEERFSFALENIRRHFYVKLEHDAEKTNVQLKLICIDLIKIAEVDDLWEDEESRLFELITNEWGVSFKDDTENESENEDEEVDEEEEKLKTLLVKYGVDSESELTSITVEQAKELSGYKGYVLNLSGLTSLSEKSVDILAKHKGNLMLDGLTSISDKALECIASHSGGYLSLDGLTNLSDKALQILSLHKELLYLNGLTSLSDKAASILSKHKGSLVLNGLTELSEKAIEILALNHRGYLSLDGLTSLSDKSLVALANHDGDLYLGITSLSDKAALALSNHKGELSLNGVTTLSDKAAFALAKHEGEINMDGLTSLSDKAAEALAEKGIKIDEDDESEETDDVNIDDSEIKINDTHVEFFLYLTMGKTDDDLSDEEISNIINFLVEKYKNQANRNIIEKIFDESFKWWLDSLKNGTVYDELNKNLNLLDEFSSNEKLVVIKNLKKISLLDKNKATKDENELIQILNKRWGI